MASIETDDLSQMAHDAVTEMMQATATAAMQKYQGDMAQVTAILAATTAGAVHVLAASCGRLPPNLQKRIDAGDTDGINWTDAVNETSILFSALLTVRCCPKLDAKGNMVFEFSPFIVYETLQLVEKITGKRPDDDLHEIMVTEVRRFMESDEKAEDRKVMMLERLARKSMPRYGNTTIN